MDKLDPHVKRELTQGLVIDMALILFGLMLFMATKQWLWLAAGVLLGSGFLLPPLIKIMRAQR